MTTDLVSGRITSFRREQGFGLITLDDGTQVKFDSGICTMLPEEGAAVRLRVGPAKWGGGFKALHVEPAEAAVVREEPRPRSLEDQLAAVQREHLVSALTESIMDELVAARFGGKPETGTILELLDAYYTGDPERAKSDGYVRRGAGLPSPADDVLAELAALLPNAKLPRQVRWTGRVAPVVPRDESQIQTVPYEKAEAAALAGVIPEDLSGEATDEERKRALDDLAGEDASAELDRAFDGPEVAAEAAAEAAPEIPAPQLVVADPDGRERALDIASLDDVIEVANAALRRAGDGRRVYKLQTGGDWQAYLALASDRALRLASTLPFAPPPADVA